MKKWYLYFFTVFIFFSQCFAESFPNRFYIEENPMSWMSSYDIYTDHQKLGTVTKKFFSLTTSFYLNNVYNQLIAYSNMDFFSHDVRAQIADNNNMVMGAIDQQSISWFSYNKYRIFNNLQQVVAYVDMGFWGNKFYIKDIFTKNIVATIHTPFFSMGNLWTVDIINPHFFDTYFISQKLLIFITVHHLEAERIKTEKARQKAREREEQENNIRWKEEVKAREKNIIQQREERRKLDHERMQQGTFFSSYKLSLPKDSVYSLADDFIYTYNYLLLKDLTIDESTLDELEEFFAPKKEHLTLSLPNVKDLSKKAWEKVKNHEKVKRIKNIISKSKEILRDPQVEEEKKKVVYSIAKKYIQDNL